MSVYELDEQPLSVKRHSGFDLPDDVSVISILGDGTSTGNAVLQSPGIGIRSAQLTGRTTDAGEIARLRALRAGEEPVTFVDQEGSHTVVVTQFRSERQAETYFLSDWSMTLMELPVGGS